MMNSNLIKIASLFTFAQTTDVKFGKRPDDRKRNEYIKELDLGDDETDNGKFTEEMMYLPGKWPYKKNENMIKRDKEIEDNKEEDEEELDKISSSFAPKWKHDVIINYDTENFSKSQDIFMQRLGDAFWKRTCVHFVPKKFEESNKDEQFVRFVMEEPGCDEIIGMKDIKYERPQMQGMHEDCLQENTPQFTSHYLMHILGFDNEHQRPDSEDFIKVESEKRITPLTLEPPQRFGREGHNYLLKKTDSVSFQNGPFDPNSLMMWSKSYVGDITDKETGNIIENAHMGSNISQVFLDSKDGDDDIKNHDISKINKYYECEPMPELPPTTTKKPEEPVTTKEPEEPVTTKEPEEPVTTKEPEVPVTTKEPEEPVTTKAPVATPEGDPTPSTTPTPTIVEDRDCIYHIKEDGEHKKVVNPDCFDSSASINVWPAEDMIVDVELKWNIQEGGDGELSDEDILNPGRRMLGKGFEKNLKEFTENHTEEILVDIDNDCEKAAIMNADNGDINVATSVVCGRGTKTFTSQCGKGIKHDYEKLMKDSWQSKGFKAYMIATAIYTKCPTRERGIALEADKSENADDDADDESEFSNTQTQNIVLAIICLLA